MFAYEELPEKRNLDRLKAIMDADEEPRRLCNQAIQTLNLG